MRIYILTLFPEMFSSPLSGGVFRIAQEKGLLSFSIYNIRDFTHDRHRTVDDRPFGGGPGMLLKPEPIFEAFENIKKTNQPWKEETPIILLSPQGRLFNQQIARDLAQKSALLLICGHYEGVDERVKEHLATDEISIGDYVLSGGELPALVIADAVTRLIPGVLGSEESIKDESFNEGLLEYPQYTRPASYRGWTVPEILLSGNHQEIDRWRRRKSMERTLKHRQDLTKDAGSSQEELEKPADNC